MQRMPQQDAEKFSGEQVPKYARQLEASFAAQKSHAKARLSLAFAAGAAISMLVAFFLPTYAASSIVVAGLISAGVYAVQKLRHTVDLIQLAAYQQVKIVDPKPEDEIVVLVPPRNGNNVKPEALS